MPGNIQPEMPLQPEEAELVDLWRKARRCAEEGNLIEAENCLNKCRDIIGTYDDYKK